MDDGFDDCRRFVWATGCIRLVFLAAVQCGSYVGYIVRRLFFEAVRAIIGRCKNEKSHRGYPLHQHSFFFFCITDWCGNGLPYGLYRYPLKKSSPSNATASPGDSRLHPYSGVDAVLCQKRRCRPLFATVHSHAPDAEYLFLLGHYLCLCRH